MAEGLKGIKSIEELPIAGKRVFIRLDLNVPLKGTEISDDTRIRAALPTIRYAIDKKCKIVLASHLGRPKKHDPKYSLEPVAQRLSELLNLEVILFDDPMGDGIRGMVAGLKENQILLLENTRFAQEEEKNSMEMATLVSSYADVYINDAFGAIHRAHATVDAVPRAMKIKGVGFLIKKEVEMLDQLLHSAEKPFLAILGGAKVSDKIGVIENLMDRVDGFVIGGAMAYTFLKAQNVVVGKSLVESEKVHLAKDLIERCRNRNKTLILPVDHVVASELKAGVATQTTPSIAIPGDLMGLDIGPKTVELIRNEISNAKTIFWNGPMGAFETPPFEKGTFAVAHFLAEAKAFTAVGGGDSVTAVEKAGLAEKMDHISTGGGASLEYLEGQSMPGLEALRT